MKLEDLKEAQEAIGVVLSHQNGKFYDIDFVDYNTLDQLQGHLANLGNGFINIARDNEAWDQIIPFFKKHLKAKPLGEEYSDEDAEFFLFGPMSVQDLGQAIDMFREEVA